MTRKEFFANRLKRSFNGQIMDKAITRVIENQDRFYALLRSTNEPGIDDLIASIHRSDFFRIGCNTHHKYATGLVEHSLGVYDQLVRLANGNLEDRDMILAALLHDLCSAKTAEWPHVQGKHGLNSYLIAEKYLPGLSQKVKEAIKNHMHEPSADDAVRNPLWALLHEVDHADAATSPGRTLKFMELGLGHKEEVLDKLFNKEEILSLLKATKRKNIHHLCYWLEKGSAFFDAPASKNKHNVFRGGLAKHSLDVYYEAMELNKTYGLPVESVTLCALLHDVCKHDQYTIDRMGRPQGIKNRIAEGHGLRSVEIITKFFNVPLTEDEKMAIWWHMGQYEESRKKYPRVYAEAKDLPLVQLINKADGIAAAKAMNC